jgi:hypothetical protein
MTPKNRLRMGHALTTELALEDLGPARAICDLLDFLEDVVFWIKDRSGRYCWVNVANLVNLGLSRRERCPGQDGLRSFAGAHRGSVPPGR